MKNCQLEIYTSHEHIPKHCTKCYCIKKNPFCENCKIGSRKSARNPGIFRLQKVPSTPHESKDHMHKQTNNAAGQLEVHVLITTVDS
jgi:hypothetical protein